MVEILCPHCDEEIALDDDASGEFGCPHCEGEFEWNTEPVVKARTRTSKKSKTHYGPPLSSIHPIKWLGDGLSVFVLVFLIIALTSSNYYSISVRGDSDSMAYGRSSFSEGATYSAYSDAIADLEEESYEICGPDKYSEGCLLYMGLIDYFEMWSMAGSLLGIFLYLALLCSIAVIASRTVLLLDHLEIMQLQERTYIASTYGKRYLPFVIGGLLFIGMLLYMLISPGAEMSEGLAGAFGDEIDSGFGLIVWFSLLLAIVYPVLSFVERNIA
jgi:hypothetical protein